MNIPVARELVTELRQKVVEAKQIEREVLLTALEQLEIALQDDPPATLQINVSDNIDLSGSIG